MNIFLFSMKHGAASIVTVTKEMRYVNYNKKKLGLKVNHVTMHYNKKSNYTPCISS